MRDFQPKDKRIHCILGISYAVLLIVTVRLTALAQLKPPNDIPGSPQSSQTTSVRSATSNEEQVIVNTDLVTLTVSVADPDGRFVPGLNRADFTVTDNKIPQEIGFFSDADLPVSVGIVFDLSGSMSGKKIERAKEALSSFIQTSHPDDEYFLIGFSSRPELLLDRTRDGDAVVKKLSFVEPHGSTALYDASYLALEHVMRGVYPKRAILIISDGQDNNSRYTFSDLRRSLMESDVMVYAIGINGGIGVGPAVYGNLVLDELASVSGGKVFFPRNSTQMNEALEQIALELRHQYSIGYRPSNFTVDGKWHRVRVKVAPPPELNRVWVRSREGYFAVGSQR